MDLILNIYKEKDYTSFNTVRLLRKKFHIKRIGYIGTLDPFATGVLPVFTGNFTKLIPYIKNEKKIYKFIIQFGILTDTLDITGNIIEKRKTRVFDKVFINEIVKQYFFQDYYQVPPIYSAKKINGKRSYKFARNNEKVDLQPVKVNLIDFEVLEIYEDAFSGIIETSKGFYVRAFARDLANKMGTIGIVKELQRIKSGDFSINDSLKIENIGIKDTLNIIDIMKNYMKIKYEENIMNKLKNGQIIYDEHIDDGLYLFVNEAQTSIIICEAKDKFIRVKRVIR